MSHEQGLRAAADVVALQAPLLEKEVALVDLRGMSEHVMASGMLLVLVT